MLFLCIFHNVKMEDKHGTHVDGLKDSFNQYDTHIDGLMDSRGPSETLSTRRTYFRPQTLSKEKEESKKTEIYYR